MKLPLSRALRRALASAPESVVTRLLGSRRSVVDGVTLDARIELLMVLAERAGQTFEATTVDAMREGYAERSLTFGPWPRPVRGPVEIAIPVANGAIRARIYRPVASGRLPLPAVVVYHGGGWVLGGLAQFDRVARFIAARGRLCVVSVDYRLAPEVRFPAAYDDAFAAYRFTLAEGARFGLDIERVAVAGDSAGGNLAAVVCRQARDEGVRQPRFAWLIYPATDAAGAYRTRAMFAAGLPLTSSAVDWFLSQFARSPEDLASLELSPLRAPSLAELAPAYITAAGFDPLRDEGQAYAQALGDAGVPTTYDLWPTLAHGFVNFAGVVPDARRALERGIDALGTALGTLRAPDDGGA